MTDHPSPTDDAEVAQVPTALRARPDDRFAVCVFCSASGGLDPAYEELADLVGARIAQAGWRLVYGGGQVGLMGVMARAALREGGVVTGIIPHRLNSREVAFDAIDDLVTCDTMGQRKQLMDDRADSYVVLPGGIGTLDELFEVMTTRQLGYHDAPIHLISPDDYWQPLLGMLDQMVERGTLGQQTRDILSIADGPDQLFDRLTAEAHAHQPTGT